MCLQQLLDTLCGTLGFGLGLWVPHAAPADLTPDSSPITTPSMNSIRAATVRRLLTSLLASSRSPNITNSSANGSFHGVPLVGISNALPIGTNSAKLPTCVVVSTPLVAPARGMRRRFIDISPTNHRQLIDVSSTLLDMSRSMVAPFEGFSRHLCRVNPRIEVRTS